METTKPQLVAALNKFIEPSTSRRAILPFIIITDITDDMLAMYKKAQLLFGESNKVALNETLTVIFGDIAKVQP